MSLKDLLRRWLFPATEPVKGNGATDHRCPLGHWLDPSWTECPRCKAESLAAHRAARPRITQFESEERGAAPPLALRGVLVTFSWDPRGELFPVREGESTIGAVATDAGGGIVSDICITRDAVMSGRHARIRCRGESIVLTDLGSSNGTRLDDELVGPGGAVLESEARITTGRTVWQFLRVQDLSLRPTRLREEIEEASSDDDPRVVPSPADPGTVEVPPSHVTVEVRQDAETSDDEEAAARASWQRCKRDPTRFGDEREPAPAVAGRQRPTRSDELQSPQDRSPGEPAAPAGPDKPSRRRGTRFE